MKKSIPFILFLVLMGIFYSMDVISFSQIEQIRTFVLGFGLYAPIIFILLFAIAPLIFFPDGILAIAGGLIFGVFWGSVYIMLGALCGGTLSFALARLYGNWVRNKLKNEKLITFQDSIKRHGFVMILLLRLVPLVPFNIISYSAGFSTIRYRDFFFATLFGMTPGVIVYANIGAQSLDIGTKEFYISIALFVGLIIISLFLKQRVKKRLERYEKKA